MNTDLKKAYSLFNKLRRLLNEQLWLILLLTPLVLIAALIGPQFQLTKMTTLSASRSGTKLKASLEISSAELALIVAKPLSELLVMEVYSSHTQQSRNKARISSLDLAEGFKNADYNQSLVNHVSSDVFVDELIKDRIDG